MISDLPKVHTVCSFLICVCVCHISFSPQGMKIGMVRFVAVWNFLLLRLSCFNLKLGHQH